MKQFSVNSATSVAPVELVENFLKETYEFRKNVLNSKLEVRGMQIPNDKLIDNDSEIDYDQLYAQAVYELQVEHKRYYFTNDEVKTIQLANNRFQKSADIDDMIDDCLRHPEEGEQVSPLSIRQIIEVIKVQYPTLNATHALKIHLGRHLVQHGFESKPRNTGSVYFAVPLIAA